MLMFLDKVGWMGIARCNVPQQTVSMQVAERPSRAVPCRSCRVSLTHALHILVRTLQKRVYDNILLRLVGYSIEKAECRVTPCGSSNTWKGYLKNGRNATHKKCSSRK